MPSNQIAGIVAAISETMDRGPAACVTFEIVAQPQKWVQFVDRTINAAYPHAEHPATVVLETSAPAPALLDWKPHKYATFELSRLDAGTVARWIDRYFVHVLQCEDNVYHVAVSISDDDH